MAFIIVAAIILIINAIFLVGSLFYTLKTNEGKVDSRLSTLPCQIDPRISLQPQVVLYEAIARMSGNPELHSNCSHPSQISQKQETPAKQVA